MIQTVRVYNFKSILSLELELGRVNVLIGENGCGKTNILEAIGFGSLAAQNKLDIPNLQARGIRTPTSGISSFFKSRDETILELGLDENRSRIRILMDPTIKVDKPESILIHYQANEKGPMVNTFQNAMLGADIDSLENAEAEGTRGEVKLIKNRFETAGLFSYMKFTPDFFTLESLSDSPLIQPFGSKGEGLFRTLRQIKRNQPKKWKEIQDGLADIEWFEGLDIPSDLFEGEKEFKIRDRHLGSNPEMPYLDQRSANEGFLFLLFYFTLFVAEEGPKFFAIDNIDQALNPRLCKRLIETLTKLATKYEKQVLLTTHNPAILDGLDLTDDQQRLFVVYRNTLGDTVVQRHERRKPLKGIEETRLSEAFIRGNLGGVPSHF